MCHSKTFRTELSLTYFTANKCIIGIYFEDTFTIRIGAYFLKLISVMNVVKVVNSPILFSFFKRNLVWVKITFLVQGFFAILIGAVNLFESVDFVDDIVFGAIRAKYMWTMKYRIFYIFNLNFSFTYGALVRNFEMNLWTRAFNLKMLCMFCNVLWVRNILVPELKNRWISLVWFNLIFYLWTLGLNIYFSLVLGDFRNYSFFF
jgi:hypothetical protein